MLRRHFLRLLLGTCAAPALAPRRLSSSDAHIAVDLARPGGDYTGVTVIELLPGTEHLGAVDDLMYFQQKLYKELSIPDSYRQPRGPT